MKHLNFSTKSGSQSGSHRVVTLASTVGSPSAHRRGAMLKLISVLVLILTIGVGNAWGDTSTMEVGSTNNPSSATGQTVSGTNSITWDVSSDAQYWNGNDGGAIHGGSGKKTVSYITFTSDDFAGKTITSVKVTARCANSTAKASVTINGDAFGSETAAYGNSLTEKEISATGVAVTGDVVVTIARSSAATGAIYVSKIIVTYTTSGSPSLSSVTVSGTPTTTTYEEGNVFNVAGLTVTGGYSDASSAAITEDITWKARTNAGSNDEVALANYTLTAGQTSLQVQATVSEIASAWYTVSGLTVNEHVVTPGKYDLILANAFWGTSGTGANAGHTASGKQNDISVSIAGSSGTQNYINDSETRVYGSHTITFSVPSGYVLKEITDLGTESKSDIAVATGSTGSIDTRVWSGSTQSVTFNVGGRTDFTTVSVTYAADVKYAVSFSAPTGGTLVIKDGDDAITSGDEFDEDKTLTVTVTPDGTHIGGTIAVAKTVGGDDVTASVLSGTTLTVPAYAITVSATFTPTYSITKDATGGSVALEDENGAPIIGRVAAGTEIIATATADGSHVFESLSLSDNVTVSDIDDNVAMFTMPAGDVTITATFTDKPCTKLGTPANVIVGGTSYPYNAATLNWDDVSYADAYEVTIKKAGVTVESDIVEESEYSFSTTLLANTEYSYEIVATSNDAVNYCASEAKTDNFSTTDYPSVTVTYSENGNTDNTASKQIMKAFKLPTSAAECSKTFVGWTTKADFVDGNESLSSYYAKGANFTITSNADITLYAVYATSTPGVSTLTKMTKDDALSAGDKVVVVAKDTKYALYQETVATSYVKNWEFAGDDPVVADLDDDKKLFDVSAGSDGKWKFGDATNGYLYDASSNKLYVGATQGEWTLGNNNNGTFTLTSTQKLSCRTDLTTENANYWRGGNSNGSNVLYIYKYATGSAIYSEYAITCAATPTATPSVNNLNNVVAGGASGTITMTYTNVNASGVTVGLFNDEACTEAFDGGWLTASLNGDKNIAYSITENTSYNDVRSAYIKLTAPETTGATDPAVVIIPVSQVKKPAVFASLQDLVAADVNSNTDVTVSFENVPIKEFYYYPDNSSEDNRKGIVFNIQKAGNDIKIYFSTAVPAAWTAGGKVSGTLTDCPWKTYSSAWQLAPKSGWAWNNLSYTAPPVIDRVEIRGTASKTTYIDGQAFKPEGLSVIAVYDNDDEEDVTEYTSWTYSPATLSTSDDQVTATATYNSKSDSKTIDVTVSPIPDKTVAQFIAAGGTRCYLEGIVSNYSNKTKGYFDLTDASGTLYIYGCTSPSSFAEGDKVKVIAETYEYYNNETHEAKSVVYVSKVSPVAITITDAGSLSVEKDQTLTISATTDPEGAVANITYNVKAGSEDYASIEDNVVTGLAKGTATIIASIPAGEGYLANSVEFEVEVVEYYSITYEENGGSTVADVAKALVLPNPLPETTRENYTFDGWYTTSTFDAETEAVAGATLTGNVTLYAKWTEIPVWARTYGSNVALVGGGTSHEDANVVINAESYIAEKAGASKNTGTISITVPAGTNAVHFHGFAWNGQSATISVAASPAVTNLSASSFALAGDAAGSGSGTYTINSNPVNHYNFFTFDAVEEATTFTFSKTGGSDNRFIIYGVNAIYPEITLSPASYDFENVRANATKEQVFSISANENVSGALSASIIEDASSKYSVSAIEDNKVTVTFDPDGAEEGTFTAKLKITASNASVTADLSGTAISAAAPMIVTDKSSIAFGRIEPNTEASAMVAVELQNIDENGVTAALSGDDAAKFALSATKLTADGNLVITPTTSAQGIFSATLTLSATDANDVVLPISMTVASKWATTYTSNVEVTTGESKKANINSTDYDAFKKAKAENATLSLPKGTQKLHLHVVAWNGEDGDVIISGSCFNEDKVIAVTDNAVVSGTGATYTFTEAEAISYYCELAIENEIGAGGTTVSITKSGSRIVLFGVNQEGGTYEIEDNTNISTLPENANVEVKEGVTLTIDEEKPLGDITVSNGGTVVVNNAIVANNLVIQTTSGSTENDGKSGQLTGSVMPVVSGDLFIEIKLCEGAMDEEASRKWYCISAPFNVNMNGGFFWGDGTPMVLNTDFQLFEWDGDRRATGISGWKRVSGVMKAGIAYFIGFDDENSNNQNIIKLKATNKTISNKSKIEAPEHSSSVDDKYANWNGLANPNFRHIALNKDVQAFDHNVQAYTTYATDEYNFVVGTPFFIKETGDITIEAADNSSFRAPKREVEQLSYCVRIVRDGKAGFDNQMYVRASEEASASYEEGHDLVTMNNETSNYGALLWSNNYGKRLAIEEAPLVNDKATYALSLYAPADGAYRIETPTVREDASLYLTYEGNIIWDLTAGAYELDLNKGATEGYGLMLVRKAPQVTTGVENVQGDKTQCTKVILNDHVYILREGQLYDVTGKAVK